MNMTVLRSRERAFDHVHDVRTWTTSASARPHTASRSHWPRHADPSHRANSMGRSLPSLPSFLPSQHTVIRTDSHSVPGKPSCDHSQCSSNRKGSVSSDCTTRERPGKDPRAYEGRRMHWTWIESEGATKEAHFASGMGIQMFHDVLQTKEDSRNHFPRLSGTRLVCHCTPSQACHADSIMSECRLLFPTAYDPEAGNGIVLRLDPDTDDQSSPDEGAPARGSGKPSQVGIMLYSSGTVRRSQASPGRWQVENPICPDDDTWNGDHHLQSVLAQSRYPDASRFPHPGKSFSLPF